MNIDREKCGSIYKGEEQMLIVPTIPHVGVVSVDSHEVQVVDGYEDYLEIGNKLFCAKRISETSPPSEELPREREARVVWKIYAKKCNGWKAFWRTYLHAFYEFHDSGEFEVFATKKIKGGGETGCIKKIILSPEATPEELGKAVMEVFEAAEEYFKENKF